MKQIVVALAAGPLLVAGCTSAGGGADTGPRYVDDTAIESRIGHFVAGPAGLYVKGDVSCPRVEVEVGRTFVCIAKSDGYTTVFDVTIQNEHGDVAWAMRQP